jgi:hypothetical protein
MGLMVNLGMYDLAGVKYQRLSKTNYRKQEMMNRFTLGVMVAALALGVSGCSTLAVMQPVERISTAKPDTALINFVRPSIFLGDGVNFEAWDGPNFVGTLQSGTMIQLYATPGEHVFMVNPTRGGTWAHKTMTVEAGQVYYIKPNTTMVSGLQLGLAESTDARIPTWNTTLTPMGVDKSQSTQVPQESIDEANQNLIRAQQK